MGFTEASTIQRSLVEWAEEAGWEYLPGAELPRDESLTDVVIDVWAREALLALNPDLVGEAESAEIVMAEVVRATLEAQDGLIAANETLTVMLRGHHAFKTVDGKHEPRRFIDFEHPERNRFVVADEVTIKGGPNTRRFDIVYYVNGFPLVVVETKTPVNTKVSWLDAAQDLYETYEVEYPQFFAPNVFVVATEGLTLRMAAVRSEPDPESELWAPWGSTEDDAKLTGPARVERAARLLLRPETVLRMLHDFAMYRHATSASEVDFKLLPRYPQYEAAMIIHDKVLDGAPGGLIWHHQGSGKTELMAFASSALLGDPAVGDPTIVVIADRKDLVRQTAELFNTTGMPRVSTPDTKAELHRLLRRGDSGVVITTVHKFAEAGHLNDRSNIVVLVDEAHRSQEGTFGKAWRAAVPNARFFGATGTAIEDSKRSTFKLFGDPDDPGFIMSRYTPEQSIADGFTKPVIVEPSPVEFHLNKEELDEAFDEMAETEGLSEEDKEFLAGKASHAETVLSNPERIVAVCRHIVEHYLTYVEPLGQKAQVVAYNQDLVVAYSKAIHDELTRRGSSRTVGVVMHVYQGKHAKKGHQQYALTDEQEEALKRRFKKVDDPLSFIVVTAKWMTGFNAPIEGVLYLDKPLKAANLFQTITRPNRPWKNPQTGQRKDYGRVVDYIGLAKAIGEALLGPRAADRDDKDDTDDINVADISQLVGRFFTDLSTLDALFTGIDTSDPNLASLAEAHERIPDGSPAREQFVQLFVALQAIWEFLDPNPLLATVKSTYLWLAKVYQSVLPRDHFKTFLWAKYGAKTQALVHASMSNVRVRAKPGRSVTLDAAGLALVKRIAEQLRLAKAPTQSGEEPGDVYEQVLDTIEARLKRRVESADATVYRSLAERIEKLRTRAVTNVEESLAFLEEALQVARDVVAADRAAEAGDIELYDPKTGALTQIVEENTPPGLHKIVPDIVHAIDSIVVEVAYAGWHENSDGDKAVRRELRSALGRFGLPPKGALFDKTYDYVRENY